MNYNKAIKIVKKNIRRDPHLAFASILVMTLTFLTLNLFIFSVVGSGVILEYLSDKAQVSIFFLDTKSEEEILVLKNKLEEDTRVKSISYVSKDQALKNFTEINKDEPVLLESVESNPLPASLEVRAQKLVDLQKLSEEFEQIDGVDDVRFYQDVVDKFRKWATMLRIGSFALLFILSTVSVIVILTTIGITIHSKGIEVEILKLVGATDSHVKTPLVLQGVFYGISAAIISTIVLFALIPVFSPMVNSLFRGIEFSDKWWVILFWSPIFGGQGLLYRILSLFGILFLEMVFGIFLGYIGSTLAIRKYLKY